MTATLATESWGDDGWRWVVMGRMLVNGIVGIAAAWLMSCSGKDQQESSPASASTNEPGPSESPTGAPGTSQPLTEDTADGNSLALPEGFAPVEGTEFKPFPEACDTSFEQKCNGSCVGADAEVNGCAFVNSSVIWRGIVSDEQGTFVGYGGLTSNSILYLDPSAHRLVEFGTFAGTQSDSFDLALDANRVYVTVADTLIGFPRDGSPMEVIVEQGFPSVFGMIVVDDVAYGKVPGEDELVVLPLGGGPSTTLPFEGTDLIAAAPDFFYTLDGAVYRVNAGDVANPTVIIEPTPDRLLGVRGEWLYGLVFGTAGVFDLHRWRKAGGEGQRIGPLTLGSASLGPARVLFSCPTDDAEFVCSFDLEGADPRVHGYLPPGAPAISVLVADDQYVYAGKGTLLARFRL